MTLYDTPWWAEGAQIPAQSACGRLMDWPARPTGWPVSRIGGSRSAAHGVAGRLPGLVRLRPAQLPGDVAQIQPRHLVFQGAEWNAEVTRRGRDIPVGLLERAEDEVALERIARLLEERLSGRRRGVQLGEVILERQVLVGDPVLVVDGDQPLDQVLELPDVPRPPVRREDLQRRPGNA